MKTSCHPLQFEKAEPGSTGQERAWKWGALYLGIWTLVSLYLSSADLWFMRRPMGPAFTPARLAMFMTRGYSWALVSLLTLLFIRRMPLHRGATRKTWVTHALLGFLVTFLGLALEAMIDFRFYPSPASFRSRWWLMVTRNLHFSYLVYYWGTVAIHEGIQVLRLTRYREQLAHQLQTRLTRAQLNALRMQLSPHFLFNTLNTVAAQIHGDPREANQSLLQLSELLRTSLSATNDPEIPLSQEVAFIKCYLGIEQLRFRDRLRFDFAIEDSASTACVPAFLLQPMVESAIRHAVTPFASGASIHIRGCFKGGSLVLEVEHDGPNADGHLSELRSDLLQVHQRLDALYGSTHDLQVSTPLAGGTLIRIVLPHLTATPIAAPLEPKP